MADIENEELESLIREVVAPAQQLGNRVLSEVPQLGYVFWIFLYADRGWFTMNALGKPFFF